MAFDERDVPPAAAQQGLRNYWGYSSHSFFCPHPGYCVTPELGSHRREFSDMVKAFHRAGIGVILDVVLNHTSEGGARTARPSLQGPRQPGFLSSGCASTAAATGDYTGCGNTLNANHPIVADLLHDCLIYWVKEFHVDGFRFDLASALSRGEDGQPLRNAPCCGASNCRIRWRIPGSSPRPGMPPDSIRWVDSRVPVAGMEWTLPRRRADASCGAIAG